MWRRLYGNAVIAAHLRGQKGIPYWPRPRLDARRDRNIREIVRYAAHTVPHYRDVFARQGIDPRQIRGAEDLDRLPLLDKEQVRQEPKRFVADGRAGRDALSFLTSGSTGRPIEIRHDQSSLLANIAYGEREREPTIRVCGGSFRPKELYVGYETSTFKAVVEFYRRNTLMPVQPRRRFVPLQEPIERVAEIVREEQPDILVGYGGWIDLFFRTIEARGIEVPMPRVVMYMGEALPHGGRAFIEESFGVPVLSRYNAVESFKIGFYCEERSGFHLHEDLCHVRVIDGAGNTAPPGVPGRVVISNLVNRATVLLNYPIGDVAAMTTAGCGCGRTLRVLSELEGRVEDVLALPDGGFVHPRAVWEVFKSDRDVLQYQLTQRAPHGFALTLVSLDEDAYRRALERALPRLRRLLGEAAVIDTSHRTEVLRKGNEKFRAVASM